jgi:NAD(P)H-nitrite reductase large subunit
MLRDTLRFDAAVLCVGVKPDVALAEDAGLETGRGILVNDHLETSNPDIYAAGDCAEHADGSVTDLWHAAEYQGEIAAKNAAGGDIAYDGLLFRLKLEVFDSYFFSINKPRDPLAVENVESEIGKLYQCFFFEEDRLTGAIMVNDKERAKEYQQAVRESWEKQRVLEHFDRAPVVD